MTHPNALGHARYWEKISKNDDGSVIVRMSRQADSKTTRDIQEKILWAICWSTVCIRNGFELFQDTVRMLLER